LLKSCEIMSPSLEIMGCKLFFKLESFQVMGSFKIRGIINQLLSDSELSSDKEKGLISMSAGNFGRSFSYLTSQLGLKATIVMPDNVPQDRIDTIKSFKGNVILAPRTEVQIVADDLVSKQNLKFVHPFDDPKLIEGYGSVGLEILEDMKAYNEPIDIVLVGVGGGGLLSGIASAIRLASGNPSIKIIGVEPSGAPKMYESIKQGKPVKLDKITTFVNGLGAPYAGKNAYFHVSKYVDEVILVEDDYVKQAMKILYEQHKIVTESAGAACVAALLSNKLGDVKGKNIVCVISGGNVSIQDFHQLYQ